ncbi:MAG: CDP-alcohol phosphatidyltransferase family protein [Candidatus Micrarchaeota archaeon]|nr:CDP-alcohol phosphatidyltransferase family protein [Candidatus Micrarchaeota archaeon]
MRSADASTIIRTGIILFVIYLILVKADPLISIALLAFAFIMDGVDGFLALSEESKGKITLRMYVSYSLGNKRYAKKIKDTKNGIEKSARYGPRFDVAADRISEYSFWALFTFVGILPFFLLVIVIIRHSIADAFLGTKGTSSKMKTGIASALYASSISRAGVNVLKFVTFSYLILAYVSSYPLLPAYALSALLVIFIVARGAAEVYESIKD